MTDATDRRAVLGSILLGLLGGASGALILVALGGGAKAPGDEPI